MNNLQEHADTGGICQISFQKNGQTYTILEGIIVSNENGYSVTCKGYYKGTSLDGKPSGGKINEEAVFISKDDEAHAELNQNQILAN